MARFTFNDAEYNAMVGTYGRQARHHFADPIQRDAKARAPKATGQLALEIIQFDEGDSTLIGSALRYTAPQELGADPHVIENAFGQDRVILHPGNEAQRFLRSSLFKRRAA